MTSLGLVVANFGYVSIYLLEEDWVSGRSEGQRVAADPAGTASSAMAAAATAVNLPERFTLIGRRATEGATLLREALRARTNSSHFHLYMHIASNTFKVTLCS